MIPQCSPSLGPHTVSPANTVVQKDKSYPKQYANTGITNTISSASERIRSQSRGVMHRPLDPSRNTKELQAPNETSQQADQQKPETRTET